MGTKFNKSGLTYWENWQSIGVNNFNNDVSRERAKEDCPVSDYIEDSKWKNLSLEEKIELLLKEKVKREVYISKGVIKSIRFLGTDIFLTGEGIELYNEVRKKVGRIIQ